MKHFKLDYVIILGLLLAIPIVGIAIPSQGNESLLEELKRICVGPGAKPLRHCIRHHFKELSPTSKQTLAELRPHWRESVQSCKQEAKRLCANTAPGRTKKVDCLVKMQEEKQPIAEPCATAISQIRNKS